jgi:hypothetical protein
MNGLVEKTRQLKLERTDRLYRSANHIRASGKPREHADCPTILAQLESLSTPATKADVVMHLGEFLSKIPNGAKDDVYVKGLAEDIFESQPSIGVLELGLRTLRLNRESPFPPVIKEILRALARAAKERQKIFWSLDKGPRTLECSAQEMFDPDPDQRTDRSW